MKKLLITDSFFITDAESDRLVMAGYDVYRLNNAQASEDELIEALDNVSVYIIGGTETVTKKVIDSTNQLEAIIFPGVDYEKFIPVAEYAKQNGIKIFNAPGANSVAVAEFAIGVALMMQRQLIDISRIGIKKYARTKSIQGATIGVIGAGNIGTLIAAGIQIFDPEEILYYSRSDKDIGARRADLQEVLQSSDIIFLSVPMNAGMILDGPAIDMIKKGSLIVSLSPMNTIDFDKLLPKLENETLRCAVDWPSPSVAFDKLPFHVWMSMNSHSAFNTYQAIDRVNASATATAINLLHT